MSNETNHVLIIAAHPDDEILGCGGTIIRLKEEGNVIGIKFLGEGRDDPLDNKFDDLPLLRWVETVEEILRKEKPDIIFTHYEHDLNIDHRMTYQAVITAARPMSNFFVKEIYSFEVLSSTEWNCAYNFEPDVFYELTADNVYSKCADMKTKYEKEMREWPHPRSLDGIFTLAQYRGMQAGVEYAEAFKTVRVVK